MTIVALLVRQKVTKRTTVSVGPGIELQIEYVDNEPSETEQ